VYYNTTPEVKKAVNMGRRTYCPLRHPATVGGGGQDGEHPAGMNMIAH